MKARHALELFVLGTVATFALAAWAWRRHHPAVAAEIILASPFPCPPGLPC